MKHSRSKNAVLLMIIFICSICSNNVWARETGTMDQLEKENLDDVDKMNKGRVKKREFFHASFSTNINGDCKVHLFCFIIVFHLFYYMCCY